MGGKEDKSAHSKLHFLCCLEPAVRRVVVDNDDGRLLRREVDIQDGTEE